MLRQRAGLSYSRLTCLPLEFVVRTQSPAVPSKSSEFQSKKRVFLPEFRVVSSVKQLSLASTWDDGWWTRRAYQQAVDRARV